MSNRDSFGADQLESPALRALLEIGGLFDPAVHEGVWLAAGLGKCSFQVFGDRALRPIKSVRGKLTIGDLNRFAALKLIKVVNRQDPQTWMFLPTRLLTDAAAKKVPISPEWLGRPSEKVVDPEATPVRPQNASAVVESADDLIGKTLGDRYRIESHVGSGGMGSVFRARDESMKRTVAIKTIKASERSPDLIQRFVREAEVSSQLTHPNIVALFEIGKFADSGDPYLVFEYLDGQTLEKTIKKGVLPASVAALIGQQIAKGLAFSHRLGIRHRDLKPDNVMVLPDNTAKILDFGAARPSRPFGGSDDTVPDLTKGSLIVGTPGYMAPEQCGGGPSDWRSDIFSLGVILYYAVSGQQPFKKSTAQESMAATVRDAQRRLDDIVPALPSGFSDLVDSCLEKDPERRLGGADRLAEKLTRYVFEQDGHVSVPSSTTRTVTIAAESVKAPPYGGVKAEEWVAIETLFSRIDVEVDAHWTRYTKNDVMTWNVHPRSPEAGKRPVDRFLNEARTAGLLLTKMDPALSVASGRDLADVWLDAVIANIDPISRVEMTGSDPAGANVGGALDKAVHASVSACAHFASVIRLGIGWKVSPLDLNLRRDLGVTRVADAPDAPKLSLKFDAADPNCVSGGRGDKFAVRIEKRGEGRAVGVSVVLDSLIVDGGKRIRSPNRRFPVLGLLAEVHSTDVSPGVAQYFRLFHQIDHDENRRQGEATWQLHLLGEREYLHGKSLELRLRIESDLLTRGARLLFAVGDTSRPWLQFVEIAELDD